MIRPKKPSVPPLKSDTKKEGLAIPGYKELDRLISETAKRRISLLTTEVEDLFGDLQNPFGSSSLAGSIEELKEEFVSPVESQGTITEDIKAIDNPYEKELIDAAIDVQSIYSEFVEADKFPKRVYDFLKARLIST